MCTVLVRAFISYVIYSSTVVGGALTHVIFSSIIVGKVLIFHVTAFSTVVGRALISHVEVGSLIFPKNCSTEPFCENGYSKTSLNKPSAKEKADFFQK